MQKKDLFIFYFCSLIRTFDLTIEGTFTRKMLKKTICFAFLLVYSYLCKAKNKQHTRNDEKIYEDGVPFRYALLTC